MAWVLYRVRFRLLSGVHAGWLPVGNILKTRSYVSGKTLWGAVTAALVAGKRGIPSARDFEDTGDAVQASLSFGYLFPCLENGAPIFKELEGEARDRFEYLFLDTYTSTAIHYGAGSAEENSLHEIEYIRPFTRPVHGETGRPVELVGHLAAEAGRGVEVRDDDVVWNGASLKAVLSRVQLGGKRGYGFGRVRLEEFRRSTGIFGAGFIPESGRIELPKGILAAAHVALSSPHGGLSQGHAEPLVGREWRESTGLGAGQYVTPAALCFAPGARFDRLMPFEASPIGIWSMAA